MTAYQSVSVLPEEKNEPLHIIFKNLLPSQRITDTSEPILRGMVKVTPIKERFIFTPHEEKEIRDVGYRFGFGGFSEAVYYRTYSQLLPNGQKEKFPDTIIRVVSGVMSIRKNWYITHGIAWDEKRWRDIAIRMGKACMKLQMLPPGRGLWICGTKYMYEKGAASLNNCGFTSTYPDLVRALTWLGDNLMSGCGIGFDNRWEDDGRMHLPGCEHCRFQSKCDEKDRKAGTCTANTSPCECPIITYVVHDSREGWMRSIELLMDSYLSDDTRVVHFDYTDIRGKGVPIKGFGGISSGYIALEKLHNEMRSFIECYFESKTLGIIPATIKMCQRREEQYLISQIQQIAKIHKFLNSSNCSDVPTLNESDIKLIGCNRWKLTPQKQAELFPTFIKTYGISRLVTDLCNAIGVCIISANVRRSAEISLGKPGDVEFLNLKNYKLNPERASIGWMSNNTVMLEKTEDFEYLPQIADRIRDNGEPGILNLINTERYGRIGNYSNIGREQEKDKAIGINPCITGDTMITTNKGLISVIKLKGVQFVAVIEGKEMPSTPLGFWSSGNKDIIRITLENGNSIKATRNHQFLTMVGDKPVWNMVEKMKPGTQIVCDVSVSKIVKLEPAGNDIVYDCSIPGVNAFIANGMYSHNCGEIPLESEEMCCLVDLFSNRCVNYKELTDAAELATIYASTISLYTTHWAGTNAVVGRNHRIGLSFCSIADYHDKHGFTKLTKDLKALYKIVRTTNQKLAIEACVRESIRVTTVKPNGTTVILEGGSSGAHFPCFKYAIRRVRIASDSELVPILHKAGYVSEVDSYSGPQTLVFSFPIDQTSGGTTRAATEVSLREQAMLEMSLCRIWADNSVSQTLYFNPEKESNDVENVLAQTCPMVKSLSMLPHTSAGVYPQSPFEEITEKEYHIMVASVNPVDWTHFTAMPIITRGCDGDSCIVKEFLLSTQKK